MQPTASRVHLAQGLPLPIAIIPVTIQAKVIGASHTDGVAAACQRGGLQEHD